MHEQNKDPAAVSLGRRGCQRKVPREFSVLTPEQRSEAARRGAAERWGKLKPKGEKVA
jgi:hypothetical protein